MQQSAPRRGSLHDDAVEAPPQLPLTDGRHFACRRCRRILSEVQWYATGCSDCSATMGVPDRDSLLDVATPHFHNFIGLIAPGQSWVARLIGKHRAATNGVFAEELSDDEPEDEPEEVGGDVAERGAEDQYDEEDDDVQSVGEDKRDVDAAESPAAAGVAPSYHEDGEEDLEGLLPAPVPSSSGVAPAAAAAQETEPTDAPAHAEDGAREVKRVKLEIDHDAVRGESSA